MIAFSPSFEPLYLKLSVRAPHLQPSKEDDPYTQISPFQILRSHGVSYMVSSGLHMVEYLKR